MVVRFGVAILPQTLIAITSTGAPAIETSAGDFLLQAGATPQLMINCRALRDPTSWKRCKNYYQLAISMYCSDVREPVDHDHHPIAGSPAPLDSSSLLPALDADPLELARESPVK